MIHKIVISRFNNIAAVLHNNKTQEIITLSDGYQVNDIYLGSVHRIFTGINAAFVDLGYYRKSGFIHINDIKSLKRSRNANQITDILSVNQLLLVQVIKEPTLNKGPRLTANINLFGRYTVLMPFCNTICVSRKIHDENERSHLHALAILIKPATMGVIIRSSAVGVNEEILLEDFRLLKQQWYFIQKLAISVNYPSLLYKDEDLIKKIIRDFYRDDIQKIIVDSEDGLRQVHYFLEKWKGITSLNNIKVQLFAKPEYLLEQFSINSTILAALKPKVNLSLGGYIFIETYEALTVIDVNSGSFNKTDNSKETVLRTNCYAATEIAYQLKVRNINGVIIVDFIDMQSHRDQLQLLEHFNKVLSLDNAKPKIIQLSELGLVELTRRRRARSLYELFNHRNIDYFSTNWSRKIVIDRSDLQKSSIIHKNINSLFFSKIFAMGIPITKNNAAYKNGIKVNRYHLVKFLRPRYSFVVPLIVYSEIIDISIQDRN
uniref:Ribonuclease E n=1 Tax=Rhodogorgon sp. TaxID=2485824 RepID=A0A3G3MI82_9FLOR|nr:ribonuclease E [Rhodogorgon sp.]